MRPVPRFYFFCIHVFNPRICKDATRSQSQRKLKSFQIHASVKDATTVNVFLVTVNVVSIHASVKDATVTIKPEITGSSVSIHASVKDDFRAKISKRSVKVSIHASVKMRRVSWWYYNIIVANPRICKRCDCTPKARHCCTKGFNPRICKRCD